MINKVHFKTNILLKNIIGKDLITDDNVAMLELVNKWNDLNSQILRIGGKRSTEHLCKIWLEPVVEVEDKGDLTDVQVKEVMKIATDYREKLLSQWKQFKQGKPIRIIKVKKIK